MSESLTLGSCWTCNNAASMDACKLAGSYKECQTVDDRCELEIPWKLNYFFNRLYDSVNM